MEQLAQRYVASRRSHSVRWQFVDLAAGGAMVVVLWLVIGRTVGIVFAILCGLLMVLGVGTSLAKWIYTRRAAR